MDNYSQKKCDFCGENIPRDAGRCPYCASVLDKAVEYPYGMPGQQGTDPGFNGGHPDPNAFSSGDVQQHTGSEYPPDTSGNQFSGGMDPSQDPNNTFGQQNAPGLQYGQRKDYTQDPFYTPQPPVYHKSSKPPMSNGLKVFLTMLFTLIPGIGQLAGIITAIVFMSTDDDYDRRSFGVALLVASIVMFVLACVGCYVLSLIGQNAMNTWDIYG